MPMRSYIPKWEGKASTTEHGGEWQRQGRLLWFDIKCPSKEHVMKGWPSEQQCSEGNIGRQLDHTNSDLDWIGPRWINGFMGYWGLMSNWWKQVLRDEPSRE